MGEKRLRWSACSLQERRLADIALDVLGLLVLLQLRLCDFGVFVLAITLGCCLGSLLRSGQYLLDVPGGVGVSYVSHLGGIVCRVARECCGVF